jgi:thermitase
MRTRTSILLLLGLVSLMWLAAWLTLHLGDANVPPGPSPSHAAIGSTPVSPPAWVSMRDVAPAPPLGARHSPLARLAVPPVAPDLPTSAPAAGDADVIPGEYVLVFTDPAESQAFAARVAAAGGALLASRQGGRLLRIALPPEVDAADFLSSLPEQARWSANHHVRLPESVPPPIPALSSAGAAVAFQDVALSWLGIAAGSNATWGEGVLTAVLDSGVGPHPALGGVAVETIDLLDATVADDWHGTAVATILAGRGAHSPGVAPASELLSIRVLGADGGDAYTVADGIYRAVARGANIINLCLGSAGDNAALAAAVQYAQRQGVLLIAAAGNGGVSGVQYPANYPGVIAVGAVDARGEHLPFSNWGAVDLVAPGAGVATAFGEEQLALVSGTSMATPFVTGAAAALMGANPSLTAEEVRTILIGSARDAGPPGLDPYFGSGILDIGQAAKRADGSLAEVVDMVAARPFVQPAKAGETQRVLTFYAQNRGGRSLPRVTFSMLMGGNRREQTFYNVAPGQSVHYDWELSLPTRGESAVELSVATPGTTETITANNVARGVIVAQE